MKDDVIHCAGCHESVSLFLCDTFLTIDGKTDIFCTPQCAVDFLVENETRQVKLEDHDLLELTAGDLVSEMMNGFGSESSEDKWKSVVDALERLAILLGMAAPNPEGYLGRDQES